MRNCQRSRFDLLLGNCADTIEIYIGSLRFDCPWQSARDPHAVSRDKFVNLASRGIIKKSTFF